MKAIWNGKVIAESADTIIVEGNHYFPPQSANKKYLKSSSMHTICPWKGEASYYDVEVDGEIADMGAWYYPKLSKAAKKIKGYLAFWRGVEIKES